MAVFKGYVQFKIYKCWRIFDVILRLTWVILDHMQKQKVMAVNWNIYIYKERDSCHDAVFKSQKQGTKRRISWKCCVVRTVRRRVEGMTHLSNSQMTLALVVSLCEEIKSIRERLIKEMMDWRTDGLPHQT